MAPSNKPGRIKTTQTVFDIIESIQKLGGVTTSELAETLGMAKSTAHSHLVTLEEGGYLVKEEGEYDIGLKFLDHGIYAQMNRDIARAARPSLEEIAKETGEVSYLVVEEHGQGVNLIRETGEQSVTTIDRVGLRTHLHIHAAGKAILAHLPKERVNEIIDEHGLPAVTEETISDSDELFTELAEVRKQGFALNDNEAVTGLRSVAVPVLVEGEIQGAVNISGPTNRITDRQFRGEFPELLSGATNSIELRLRYSDHD
jgi:DNA-binding IclR family transcriptional regulator